MKTIDEIFVKIPLSKEISLKNTDYIFDKPCFEWIKTNNIEDYSFVDITVDGIEFKISTSNISFKYL